MSTLPITTISSEDVTYPSLLRVSHDYPEKLFAQGDVSATTRPCISIIGSRISSGYGEMVARMLIPPLVKAGLVIVSGLAYGIDGYAHELALKAGGTCVAVLGSGLNKVYPHRNKGLLEQILDQGGCVFSEYEPDVGPKPYHFPARNRIVAALSPITLIIEAGEKSGTLITAQCALDEGRQVCVVPGDITRPGTKGIMKLLRQGACPIENPQDILQLYGEQSAPLITALFQPNLTGLLATLYDLISCGVDTTDALAQQSGLEITELQSVLSLLELDGYIYSKQNRWQKI